MAEHVTGQDVVAANKEYYNLVAEDYLKNEYYAYTNAIVADVKRLLALGASNSAGRQSFLDVGCGSGFLSTLVCEMKLFDQGIGIDVSEKQLEIYQTRMKEYEFTGVLGDAANLQFDDESFDMVAGYSVLHHFHDYQKVLNECFRVLKVGGCLYFDFEPNAKFKRSMKYLIDVRRKLFDNSPDKLDELESLAEYHNNYVPGICRDKLLAEFEGKYTIIESGWRFPGTMAGNILKVLAGINSSFAPLFYVLVKKI